jgi:hypothetical protein
LSTERGGDSVEVVFFGAVVNGHLRKEKERLARVVRKKTAARRTCLPFVALSDAEAKTWAMRLERLST